MKSTTAVDDQKAGDRDAVLRELAMEMAEWPFELCGNGPSVKVPWETYTVTDRDGQKFVFSELEWRAERKTLERRPEFDEERADAIGRNGGEGLHYQSTTAASIMRAGLGHMEDRAATYDKPQGERSMAATVAAFKATTGVEMTEEQGWHFMCLLKLVRSQQGALRMDSYEDGSAYMALAGEAAAKERG